MGPLKKYRIIFLLFFFVSMIFGVLMVYVSEDFLYAAFMNLIVFGLCLRNISCPRCGHPIGPVRGEFFGVIFNHMFRRNCRNCGARLE